MMLQQCMCVACMYTMRAQKCLYIVIQAFAWVTLYVNYSIQLYLYVWVIPSCLCRNVYVECMQHGIAWIIIMHVLILLSLSDFLCTINVTLEWSCLREWLDLCIHACSYCTYVWVEWPSVPWWYRVHESMFEYWSYTSTSVIIINE